VKWLKIQVCIVFIIILMFFECLSSGCVYDCYLFVVKLFFVYDDFVLHSSSWKHWTNVTTTTYVFLLYNIILLGVCRLTFELLTFFVFAVFFFNCEYSDQRDHFTC
jgi:hypothetical protein